MTTNEDCLPFKGKHGLSGIITSYGRYSNLDLNQPHRCFSIENVHSKDFSNKSKKVQNYDFRLHKKKTAAYTQLTDKTHDPQKSSFSWKRSEIKMPSEYLNIHSDSNKNESKNGTNSGGKNKNASTLSLHIAAYENCVAASDSFEEINVSKDKSKFINKTLANVKHNTLSSAISNPFEFPRQQTDEKTDPAVMQFSASQQLLNPNQGNDSCKTAQLPDYIQYQRRRGNSTRKVNQKKDTFIAKIKSQTHSTQRTMIIKEIAKIDTQCSRLTAALTNPQHFITKKRLLKRKEFLQNYIAEIHSPSAKTAQLPSFCENSEIPTPLTAVSPTIEIMEEKILQIKIHLKPRPLKLEDFEMVKEKVLIYRKMQGRYQQKVEEMGKKLKELEERMEKNMEVKDQVMKIIHKCNAQHCKIENDFKLYQPRIAKLNERMEQMQKMIRHCHFVTTQLDSGEPQIPWELWLLSPFYNLIIWILFFLSLCREISTKFYTVLMKDFKQKRLKK